MYKQPTAFLFFWTSWTQWFSSQNQIFRSRGLSGHVELDRCSFCWTCLHHCGPSLVLLTLSFRWLLLRHVTKLSLSPCMKESGESDRNYDGLVSRSSSSLLQLSSVQLSLSSHSCAELWLSTWGGVSVLTSSSIVSPLSAVHVSQWPVMSSCELWGSHDDNTLSSKSSCLWSCFPVWAERQHPPCPWERHQLYKSHHALVWIKLFFDFTSIQVFFPSTIQQIFSNDTLLHFLTTRLLKGGCGETDVLDSTMSALALYSSNALLLLLK